MEKLRHQSESVNEERENGQGTPKLITVDLFHELLLSCL